MIFFGSYANLPFLNSIRLFAFKSADKSRWILSFFLSFFRFRSRHISSAKLPNQKFIITKVHVLWCERHCFITDPSPGVLLHFMFVRLAVKVFCPRPRAGARTEFLNFEGTRSQRASRVCVCVYCECLYKYSEKSFSSVMAKIQWVNPI